MCSMQRDEQLNIRCWDGGLEASHFGSSVFATSRRRAASARSCWTASAPLLDDARAARRSATRPAARVTARSAAVRFSFSSTTSFFRSSRTCSAWDSFLHAGARASYAGCLQQFRLAYGSGKAWPDMDHTSAAGPELPASAVLAWAKNAGDAWVWPEYAIDKACSPEKLRDEAAVAVEHGIAVP